MPYSAVKTNERLKFPELNQQKPIQNHPHNPKKYPVQSIWIPKHGNQRKEEKLVLLCHFPFLLPSKIKGCLFRFSFLLISNYSLQTNNNSCLGFFLKNRRGFFCQQYFSPVVSYKSQCRIISPVKLHCTIWLNCKNTQEEAEAAYCN